MKTPESGRGYGWSGVRREQFVDRPGRFDGDSAFVRLDSWFCHQPSEYSRPWIASTKSGCSYQHEVVREGRGKTNASEETL